MLSSNTTFASAGCTPSGSCTHAAGVVTCAIGTVGAGAGGSCTISVTVKQPLANGTLVANTANLTDTEGDDVIAGHDHDRHGGTGAHPRQPTASSRYPRATPSSTR